MGEPEFVARRQQRRSGRAHLRLIPRGALWRSPLTGPALLPILGEVVGEDLQLIDAGGTCYFSEPASTARGFNNWQ